MKIVDGIRYIKDEEAPDIGNWECTEMYTTVIGKTIRSYFGQSADVSKLPKKTTNFAYASLGSGSTAFCVDTGDLYMYNSKTNEWATI